MPDLSFDKGKRLLESHHYRAVFDGASYKVSHKHFLILAVPNNGDQARLGLVIAKKNIRLSVHRNRIKRVVRETFRLNHGRLDSLDIVFLARKGMDSLEPAEQSRIMLNSWRKLSEKLAGT